MILAGLIAHANAKGCDVATLRALVEEASEAGAARALDRVGLHDHGAGRDVEELRELLSAWRAVKRSAGKAAVGWAVRLILIGLLIGLMWTVGLRSLLNG
ncbi:hypothetical protein B5C34_07050 [Pacificimonas flava]|uniref:Transmembrane protein n=2 Tax=Pacificimonas TaxID=1960290 RepID=A0A219BA66_9SPHN|nr:hypothetical protein B5C34_07050 [Pacificimonas flava]